MLAKRVLVAAVLLPVGLAAIIWGGAIYAVLVALILSQAAWEYNQLFRAGGSQPAGVLLSLGTTALVAGRWLDGFASAGWLLALLIFASLTYHLLAYERGRDQAGTDFAITLAGILYLGWLGSYLISLRNLPDGKWWVLLSLPTIWLVDTGAYLVGTRLGRHQLSTRLSPKKTWEGFWGGAISGILGGCLLALALAALGAGAAILPAHGALLGLALATLTPLGDLGESMIKRQVGKKDSGGLLPGHGGVFDRIDTWLWAAPLSYYLITWFFI